MDNDQDFWDEKWDRRTTYDEKTKERYVGPVLKKLDEQGKLGDIVVDVGSGRDPVSAMIARREERMVATVDRSGKEGLIYMRAGKQYHVRCDLNVLSTEHDVLQKAVTNVLRATGATTDALVEADTIILSDILNYVDYMAVLRSCASFLKSGGRVVIVNMPGRGYPEKFSELGVPGNLVLYQALDALGFDVEEKFPVGGTQIQPDHEDTEQIIVIAKKRNTEF